MLEVQPVNEYVASTEPVVKLNTAVGATDPPILMNNLEYDDAFAKTVTVRVSLVVVGRT